MKKYLIVIVLSISGFMVSAQGIALGFRAGVNNGNLTTKIAGIDQGPVANGFTGGVFGRASFLGFFAQPEINYSRRIGNFAQVGTGTYSNTLSTVDVNLLVGLSLLGIVRVNLGPTLMTLVSATQDAGTPALKDTNFGNDFFNSTAYGFQIGAGFDLGSICFDLRYDTNLTSLGKTNVNSSVFVGNTNYTTGYGMFQVTLGYKLLNL